MESECIYEIDVCVCRMLLTISSRNLKKDLEQSMTSADAASSPVNTLLASLNSLITDHYVHSYVITMVFDLGGKLVKSYSDWIVGTLPVWCYMFPGDNPRARLIGPTPVTSAVCQNTDVMTTIQPTAVNEIHYEDTNADILYPKIIDVLKVLFNNCSDSLRVWYLRLKQSNQIQPKIRTATGFGATLLENVEFWSNISCDKEFGAREVAALYAGNGIDQNTVLGMYIELLSIHH